MHKKHKKNKARKVDICFDKDDVVIDDSLGVLTSRFFYKMY